MPRSRDDAHKEIIVILKERERTKNSGHELVPLSADDEPALLKLVGLEQNAFWHGESGADRLRAPERLFGLRGIGAVLDGLVVDTDGRWCSPHSPSYCNCIRTIDEFWVFT